MAQTTKAPKKSPKKTPSTNGSQAKSAASSKGAASKRSSPKRTSSNGSRPKSSTASRPKSRTRSKPKESAAESIRDTVVEKTKAAGHSVADVASKAKTPLIAGGTAVLGVAAGAVIKDRLPSRRSKNPLKRLSGLPTPKLDPGKLDLDTIKSAADRVSSYGQQASDIAGALEKTRKKNK